LIWLEQLNIIIRGDIPINISDNIKKPFEFKLNQNYPNPFNPSTTIGFSIAKESHVTVNIYNSLGQQIIELMDKRFKAGVHNIEFDGTNLTSGIYYYQIISGKDKQTKKMLILK